MVTTVELYYLVYRTLPNQLSDLCWNWSTRSNIYGLGWPTTSRIEVECMWCTCACDINRTMYVYGQDFSRVLCSVFIGATMGKQVSTCQAHRHGKGVQSCSFGGVYPVQRKPVDWYPKKCSLQKRWGYARTQGGQGWVTTGQQGRAGSLETDGLGHCGTKDSAVHDLRADLISWLLVKQFQYWRSTCHCSVARS